MVDNDKLEAVKTITEIILNILMIVATATAIIKELCNILKPG